MAAAENPGTDGHGDVRRPNSGEQITLRAEGTVERSKPADPLPWGVKVHPQRYDAEIITAHNGSTLTAMAIHEQVDSGDTATVSNLHSLIGGAVTALVKENCATYVPQPWHDDYDINPTRFVVLIASNPGDHLGANYRVTCAKDPDQVTMSGQINGGGPGSSIAKQVFVLNAVRRAMTGTNQQNTLTLAR